MSRTILLLIFYACALGIANASGNKGGWQPFFGQFPETRIAAIAPYGRGFVGIGDGKGIPDSHLLAFWEDGVWTTAGPDPDGLIPSLSAPFTDIEIFGQDICVGGDFTRLGPEEFNKLACWSIQREQWYQPVGPGLGPDRRVSALAWDGANRLYVGGEFNVVKDFQGNDIIVNRVVATDGFSWEPLVHQGQLQNGVSATVTDIVPSLGGAFIAHHRSVSQWNPTIPEMRVIGSANNSIGNLQFFFDSLVASGAFSQIDGVQAAQVAASSASGEIDWSPYGDGLLGPGAGDPALGQGFGFLYVGGSWDNLPGANNLARWTGVVWEPQDPGWPPKSVVTDIEAIDGGSKLCAHYQRGFSGGTLVTPSIVCKDSADGEWHGISQGLGHVLDIFDSASLLERFQTDMIAAGNFKSAGDTRLGANVARWDGTRWQSLGEGLNNADGTADVRALETFGGSLYVGGIISQAGDVPISNLARWDGQSWLSVADANLGTVSSLQRHDGALYIGKNFSGTTCSVTVCSWNGSSIQPVGTPPNAEVPFLVSYQGLLIAGGSFSEAGGSPARSLASWDGSAWSEFAGGVFRPSFSATNVTQLVASGDLLYLSTGDPADLVGTDRVPITAISVWDGSQWTALGDNITQVTALHAHQGEIYAAGDITLPDGSITKTLARWNGTTWQALAAGMNGGTARIRDLRFGSDGLLYAVGSFDRAGEVWSTNIGALDVEAFFSTGFE